MFIKSVLNLTIAQLGMNTIRVNTDMSNNLVMDTKYLEDRFKNSG